MQCKAGKLFAVIFFLLTAYLPASAELRLPAIFSSHMVLQFGQLIPVWGWAEPGKTVTVTFRGFRAEATADNQGRWKVEIGPLNVGGPDRLIVSSNKEIIALDNVLAGEVWICSGQSNMEMTVNRCINAEQEIAAADFPKIRQFKLPHLKSLQPLDDIGEPESEAGRAYQRIWQPASPETVARFTAAGYFFARDLHNHLGDIPVGLINTSWGGSVAEAWVSEQALLANPATADITEDWTGYFKQRASWLESYNKFLEEVQKANAEGKPQPIHFKQPSVLYNAMLAPLVGYGMRGVIWYQGESNVFRAGQYAPLFQTLISDWRNRWGRDFPFIWVQLPNFDTPVQNWPLLRESQAAALELPGTAMAVAIDVGEQWDIHPRDKQTVGRRLALAARGMVYREQLPHLAPMFESLVIENGRCRLEISGTADSLVTGDSQSPRGFMVSGDDKVFHPAEAIIDNGNLIVWNPEVSNPVAVRYAWENYPTKLNLYSGFRGESWLPVAPFRTDNWDVSFEIESDN